MKFSVAHSKSVLYISNAPRTKGIRRNPPIAWKSITQLSQYKVLASSFKLCYWYEMNRRFIGGDQFLLKCLWKSAKNVTILHPSVIELSLIIGKAIHCCSNTIRLQPWNTILHCEIDAYVIAPAEKLWFRIAMQSDVIADMSRRKNCQIWPNFARNSSAV